MRKRTRIAVGTSAAVLFLVPGMADAQASHDHGQSRPVLSDPIAQGLAGPLQLAVSERGAVYVAQGFAPVLTRIGRHGATDIPVTAIDGIDVGGGRVLYTTRDGEPGEPGFSSTLSKLERDGSGTVIADLWAHEQRANPDKVNTYGFKSISAVCAAQLPPEIGPPRYRGQIDVNPFGVAITDERTYIADSGANAVLAVSRSGRVRTVAVLPPQPVHIDAGAAAALGLPTCTVGLTYAFEPVPTDVEVGRDGWLYVTTLPGGPEDPSLGARGSVYRINPRTGAVHRLATGLLGATNLALGPNGAIYVSELFANRISRVTRGGPVPLLDVASPAGLEYADGRLYVGYDVFGNGSVATVKLRGS